jgi:hypothetical protein
MLFLQICQVTGGDLEAVGNLGAGEKAVSHGFTLSNATTQTQGFASQAPGP